MGIRHSFEDTDLPFRLTAKRCPACGQFPRGMLTTFTGRADIYTDDDGKTFVFNGSVIPTSAGTLVEGEEGEVTLICGGGHSWQSAGRKS